MPCIRRWITAALAAALLGSAGLATADKRTETIVYDSFDKPGGYTLDDYGQRWFNAYGLLQMSLADTRNFAGGRFNIDAVPFQVGADFSVFDHLKYIAISTRSFAVPARGSITFSSVIQAETPGATPGRVIEGFYIKDGTPYRAATLEGQQAGAVMNMVDFATGQLFDWFISGTRAFTLIERLPTNVTRLPNADLDPSDPNYVGRAKMYTQIIDEVEIGPGPHTVAITYTRYDGQAMVEYFLDGKLVSRVGNIGVPLDVQKKKYTGISPSLGPGELLVDKIQSFSIGHGLFSLLDAFPYQHPESPELAVSIPLRERLFGQGARASFDDFKVTIETRD